MSTTAENQAIDQTALAELEGDFRGELIRPGDASYDERRKIWNGSIDRRPALIARCAGVADVIAAVLFARRTELVVAVRSGGHSWPGLSVCDGGMVIDLSLMKGIRVDPEAHTVRAEAGVLLGELDRETQAFGLVVPAGVVTHTGLAGLTLGGGIGHTMRRYGLTIDSLLSVDLVAADGQFIKASETENPELFWGVRGGGGNFGIVTSFEFRAHPLGPTVMAGPVFWHMRDAYEVLRFYRDWITDTPDELTTIVNFRKAPTSPLIPEDLQGKPIVAVLCTYAGPIEDGQKVIEPLKRFRTVVHDLCQPKPFVAHQAMLDPGLPHGWWYYARSCDVAQLTDDVIDITVDHSLRIRSPRTTYPIFQLGGAIRAVGDDDTAFNGRGAGHTYNINGIAPGDKGEGFDEEREWARGLWEALAPYHSSVYVNFLMDEGEDGIRRAYGPAKYQRLKEVKNTYDPDNFFRLNQNIPPDSRSPTMTGLE
ncbi:MAG TPA: FAD-binding oxidoreductase [Acidimicrobiales bacterium]